MTWLVWRVWPPWRALALVRAQGAFVFACSEAGVHSARGIRPRGSPPIELEGCCCQSQNWMAAMVPLSSGSCPCGGRLSGFHRA